MPSSSAILLGPRHGKTEKAAWGGVELLDRESVFVLDDGDSAILEPELAQALQSAIGLTNAAGLRGFLNEVLWSEGIGTMDELGGESLTNILQGILE